MAGRLRAQPGGILGLHVEILSVPTRRAALAYDLLKRGQSLDDLGTRRLSWSDLVITARLIQHDHSSALATELHGQRWSIEAQLLADVVDLLAVANWQRGGKKHAPKPKPVERPWRKPKVTKLGRDPIAISQFNDWWDSQAPRG